MFMYFFKHFRKLLKLGLSKLFKTTKSFRVWCGMVFSLPLLPPEDIGSTWNKIRGRQFPFSASEKANLLKFKKYVDAQWIQKISPAELSVSLLERRTNNDVECFNR
jgi:hypothetical protein